MSIVGVLLVVSVLTSTIGLPSLSSPDMVGVGRTALSGLPLVARG